MKYFMALILCLGIVGSVRAKSPEYFLYYNVDSPHLEEIDIERDEILKVFDDNFGPAAEFDPAALNRVYQMDVGGYMRRSLQRWEELE